MTTSTAPTKSGFTGRDAAYIALAALAIAANGIFKLDPDIGGYQDRWLTIDKMVHFAIAYAVVIAGRLFGARQAVVVATVIVGAVAFEFTQGFVSWRDILAGWAGAASAAAWWLIPERRANPR
jgi:hypothetical protein